jgi:hypothetical protein
MQHPEQRHDPREAGSVFSERGCERGKPECAAHHGEQHQRGEQMNGEVGQSIADDVEAAEGVVDRKRQVDDRSSGDRRVRSRRQGNTQRPELPDLRVVDDRGTVIEDERGRETVQVYQRAREYDDCGTERESPVSCQMRPFPNMLPTQYMKSLHWLGYRYA